MIAVDAVADDAAARIAANEVGSDIGHKVDAMLFCLICDTI